MGPWRVSRPGRTTRGLKVSKAKCRRDLWTHHWESHSKKACQEYLEYVASTPYGKEAFKRGAELGSRVLREAGGSEEANRGVRRTWVSMKGDHFEGLHSDFFEGLVSPAGPSGKSP